MPSVQKYLDLSTGHLDETTADRLDALFNLTTGDPNPEEWAYWVVGSALGDFGWFIWADSNFADDTPECLIACAKLADQLGCSYILFDRDAEPIEELPTYEW